MEGNKDESERCIQIAQKCINDGQRDKALKYLYKAEKLYPSQRAKDLIELLEKLSCSTSFNGNNHSPEDDDKENKEKTNSPNHFTRRRSSTVRNEPKIATEEQKPEYTQEQLEAVQRIKRCKDFYEILGVSKDAGDSELKKQYKKLALQFHPDKNKAPGASEAFKAIGNAFAVLSDPEKKKQYDLFGSQDGKVHQRRQTCQRREYYDYSRGFEGDISAEELFNMFFGGTFPAGMSGATYQRRNQRRHQFRDASNIHQESQNGYSALLQIMPIVFLVCLSLMSSFFISDPMYSLAKSPKYAYERKTSNLKIPYYVKETFATDYQGSIRRLEAQVEEEYVSNLRSSCFKEKNYKESMIWRARNLRDRGLEDRAKNLKTPSCELLSDLYSTEREW